MARKSSTDLLDRSRFSASCNSCLRRSTSLRACSRTTAASRSAFNTLMMCSTISNLSCNTLSSLLVSVPFTKSICGCSFNLPCKSCANSFKVNLLFLASKGKRHKSYTDSVPMRVSKVRFARDARSNSLS